MSNKVIVRKLRKNVLTVELPYSVSGDEITSQIRKGPSSTSSLIASWSPQISDDGRTIILTLSHETCSTEPVISAKSGWMDIKRVHEGEPLSVFEDSLSVVFKSPVTV